jgi:hypothetical protein
MPFRAPQANAYCQRLVGSIRGECLDYLIPLNEKHLQRTVKQWEDHFILGCDPLSPCRSFRGSATGPDPYLLS